MNAKQESETLISAILPLAEKMLRQYGEFYPYAGYMKPDGTVVDIGARDRNTDHPKSKDLVSILRASLRDLASGKRCKAAAIVLDAKVILPRSELRSDAVEVCVDHVDGYSAEVFFPYRIVDHDIVYGETFAQAGRSEIFWPTRPGDPPA